ncbi:MAG: prepilin-type N-terminal cleavage/methylation domain-containing protein [Candidatus Omnitrophica bacterium]|nr:prepilin-type N-terminal cleavage/methylation domain-containing protein [Candidatus Omnitrophota bacterium]
MMQKRFLTRKKGFTLIELIVVLVILGILAAISITSYFSWVESSHVAEANLNMKTLADQIDACIAKGPVAGQEPQTTAQNCINPLLTRNQGPSSLVFFNILPGSPNFVYTAMSSGFMTDPGYIILTAMIDSSGTPIPGSFSWTNICGSSSTTLTMYNWRLVLCRDPSGKRSLYSNGSFNGVF